MMADFEHSYMSQEAKRKIADVSTEMGPFYEKYIRKMKQMFVKDRVKRLNETFAVARSGQLGIKSKKP